MLAVINGTPKKARFTDVEMLLKYIHMCKKALDDALRSEYDGEITDRWALMKAAYCQSRILSINSIEIKQEPRTLKEYEDMFEEVVIFKNMLSLLTPREFITTFPATKEYYGEKLQCKDYFSAMDSIKGYDFDVPFAKQATDMLRVLFNYRNKYTDNVVVHSMLVIDKIRMMKGEDDMFTAFFKSQGKEPPRTFKMCKSPDGKQYMMDEDGKTFKVRKPKPRYLRVVK